MEPYVYTPCYRRFVSWVVRSSTGMGTAEKQYIVEYEKNDWYGDISQDNKLVSLPAVKQYMKKISKIEPRDYQYHAVYEAIKNNRKLLLSPTDLENL